MKTKSDPLLGIEWVIGLMLICGIIAALIYEYPEDQIQGKSCRPALECIK